MTRAGEPPPGPVVDCMERGCKCGENTNTATLSTYVPASYHGCGPRYVRRWLFRLLLQLPRLAELLRYLGPGFHPHLPGFKHQFLAKALGATMWFFIFYRARCVTLGHILITSDSLPMVHRQDGAKLLVRPVTFPCPVGSPSF